MTEKNQEYWFESSHDCTIRINCWFHWPFLGFHNFVDLFWVFTIFRDIFWAFDSGALIRTNSCDSSSMSKTWIDSTHDSSGFPGTDSESTDDSSGFPRYWLDWLMTQNASSFFDSNQLMTQTKIIWFWVDSWSDMFHVLGRFIFKCQFWQNMTIHGTYEHCDWLPML